MAIRDFQCGVSVVFSNWFFAPYQLKRISVYRLVLSPKSMQIQMMMIKICVVKIFIETHTHTLSLFQGQPKKESNRTYPSHIYSTRQDGCCVSRCYRVRVGVHPGQVASITGLHTLCSKKWKINKNNYPCTRQAENIWSHSLHYSMRPDNHLISGRLRAGSTGSLKL